ncbi:MAG: BglII/BstYI family type II restriction endonuclease, partial [Planctomycetota bacterium]
MQTTSSYHDLVPRKTLGRYQFTEVRKAAAVIAATNPQEWNEILDILDSFELKRSDILEEGGNKSSVAARLDESLRKSGWREGRVDTSILLSVRISPYHAAGEKKVIERKSEVKNKGYKVDNLKNRIALDVEWNAKDGNLDRDIGAYRALYSAALIDAAVIITRTQDDLRDLAQSLDPDSTKFATTTTTNLEKLIPRLTRGDGGG